MSVGFLMLQALMKLASRTTSTSRARPKGAFRDFKYLAGVLEKKLMDEDPDFMKKMNNISSPQEVRQ